MKSFLYDEKEMATKIYNNGFTNGYDRRETLLLAKYFRHILGYGDLKLKNKIIDFCSRDKYFNAVTESSQIKSFVKNSKYDFVINTSVFITKDEINRVTLVKNFDARKVYLALLAIARRNNFTNVSIKNITEIKKIANINCTNKEVGDLYHILYKSNLIYPIVMENNEGVVGYQKILNMEFDGQPEILINNDKEIYELGKTYEKYCGGYLLWCEDCEEEFIRKNKSGDSSRYCEKHSDERKKYKYKKYNETRKSLPPR